MKFMIAVPMLRGWALGRPDVRPLPRETAIVPVLILAGLLVAFGLSQLRVGETLVDAAKASLASVSSLIPEASETRIPPELPYEWQRRRPPISFDHMYMDAANRAKLDWIRDGASAPRSVPRGR